MQAVLLATGESKKLWPLTIALPAPMLPIAGRPVLTYPLELLIRLDCKNIVISVHTFASEIETYLGTGSHWGREFDYVLQPDAWGTAGSLKWAAQRLDDTFIVLPADSIVDIDLKPVYDQHVARGSVATVVVTSAKYSQQKPSWLQHMDAGQDEALSETGVYIFNKCVLDYIPARSAFEISTQLIPQLIKSGVKVDRYLFDGYWNAINNYAEYHQAQADFLQAAWAARQMQASPGQVRYPVIEGRPTQDGIWIGRYTTIHPSARLIAPVQVGENCMVGKDVELGPNVVIGDSVMIDDGATVTHSTIMDHSYIGQYVNLDRRLVDQSLLIDPESTEMVNVTDRHFLSSTFRTIEDSGLNRFFDAMVATIVFLVSLPFSILLLLLLLIFEHRGIHRQARVHRCPMPADGSNDDSTRNFWLLRFSTRDKEGKSKGIGRWIEKTGLHRMPELLNVIAGDLRLVGVKPLTPDEAKQIIEPWQERRYEVEPGLTGLWYLQTSWDSSLDEILVADAYYAATRTWLGDLKVMLTTVGVWFRRMINASSPI